MYPFAVSTSSFYAHRLHALCLFNFSSPSLLYTSLSVSLFGLLFTSFSNRHPLRTPLQFPRHLTPSSLSSTSSSSARLSTPLSALFASAWPPLASPSCLSAMTREPSQSGVIYRLHVLVSQNYDFIKIGRRINCSEGRGMRVKVGH